MMGEVELDLPYMIVMGRNLVSWGSGTLWGAYVRVCPEVDAYRFGIVRLGDMVHSYMWNMASQVMLEEL